MILERWILVGVWVIAFALLFAIPRDKIRVAVFVILLVQAYTYLLGSLAVEFGLIAYPARIFLPDVIRSSLTYEFVAYPVVSAVAVTRYPFLGGRWLQLFYIFGFSTVLTVPEIVLEKFTNLVRFIHWDWFWSWATLFILFIFTLQATKMFFNER